MPDNMGSTSQDQTVELNSNGDAQAAVAPADEAKAAAPAEKKTATVLGDFQLVKKLGQGGMGAVYQAKQISLDRTVAIKVMTKELAKNQTYVERFLREAKLMAKLDHPNILRCFHVGEALGFHYLAIEFVEGGSVDGWLKKSNNKFSLGDAMHVIYKTAQALEHAHELSLIHRDIKPENILLTKTGLVKVADFGLAKNTEDDQSLTRTGTGAGTPIYMAPEQARDVKRVDQRVDIYALGIMLYAMVTGRAPFQGNTIVDLITAKEKGKFPPMRQFCEDVPERLDLILDKMIAVKPEHRFASCTEILEEFDKLGLHNQQLTFFGGAAAKSGSVPVAPSRTETNRPANTTQADDPKAKKPSAVGPDDWFLEMVSPTGKTMAKRVTTDQVRMLIKSGSVAADAKLAKSPSGPFRSIGTYGEFLADVKAKSTSTKASAKGEKYRSKFDEIVAQDAKRRQWKWLRGLFSGAMSWVYLLVLLTVLGVGLYFGITWFISTLQ